MRVSHVAGLDFRGERYRVKRRSTESIQKGGLPWRQSRRRRSSFRRRFSPRTRSGRSSPTSPPGRNSGSANALHDGRRHFANAIGNEFCDVFVISWSEGSDTGFHDHGLASGAVACCLGQVVEERLRIGGENRRTILSAGDAISFDGSHVHRMTDAGTGPAVTIHAYSPRPERIGQFAFEADGTVRRVEISWAAELVNAAAGL